MDKKEKADREIIIEEVFNGEVRKIDKNVKMFIKPEQIKEIVGK